MTNTEKIREACIKANDEIVELKFGCRVRLKSNPFDEQIPEELERYYRIKELNQIITEIKDVSKVRGTTGLWIKTNEIPGFIDKVYFDVIGRKITLEDVLLAIEKQIQKEHPTPRKRYEVRKILFIELLSFWDLKEPMENQSEETKASIAELV